MRHLHALVVLVTLAWPNLASASYEPIRKVPSGDWEVLYEANAAENYNGACELSSALPRGLTLGFYVVSPSRVYMGLSHPKWNLPKDTKGVIKFHFSNGLSQPITLSYISSTMMGNKNTPRLSSAWQDFEKNFSTSSFMSVQLPDGEVYTADLSGSASAIKEFENCARTWAGRDTRTNAEKHREVAATRTEPRKRPAKPETSLKESTAPAHLKGIGTAFIISRLGWAVTNYHVIEACTKVVVVNAGGDFVARVQVASKADDLAVLKLDGSFSGGLQFPSAGPRIGANVSTFGFPLADALSSTGNFTTGNVTALAGLQNDSRYLQISTPVQPGNSGGALLDSAGRVVGVVSAKLNALKVAASTGDIPQNVNFAIKEEFLRTFLEANNIPLEINSSAKPMAPEELAATAQKMSFKVLCY